MFGFHSFGNKFQRFGKYGLQVVYDADMEMWDVYTTDSEGNLDTLVNSFTEECDAIKWADMMETE